jgi:hypothetical protein
MRPAIPWLAAGLQILVVALAEGQTGLIPPPGNVKVTVEFRQVGQSLQGGTIVQGGPRGARGSAQVQVQETQRLTRRSVGSFLLIQDGGEGSITVADQVAEFAWLYQYALGRNYITPAVVFRQVGTSFVVRPAVLPNRRIRLRITPQLSYRSDTDAGTIELVEASTEVVVPSGQPITIGGSEGGAEVVRQFLLGYERANRASQVSIVLTAEAQ